MISSKLRSSPPPRAPDPTTTAARGLTHGLTFALWLSAALWLLLGGIVAAALRLL